LISEEAIARVGSLELYIDVTLLVALAGVVWTFARRIAQELYFQLSLRTREIEIALEPKENVPDELKELHLLFVRYGNDTYLKELASDQERYHGRLRNKVTRIPIDRDRVGKDPLKIKIKLHKRLGTQFKFFVEVEGDPNPVVTYLKSHDTISDVDTVNRPSRRTDSTPRSRIFFIVNRFDVVTTVEGFKNNFVFPV
jgi:hypothetical protein